MDRKEFLSAIGLSTGVLFVTACLGSCKKSSPGGNTTPTSVTLDITQPAYAALQNPGGYIYTNGLIVAKTMAGAIIAVSQSCTHEGATVVYQGGSDRFYCPRHGATYNDAGGVTGGPAPYSLTKYNVSVNGNTITITG